LRSSNNLTAVCAFKRCIKSINIFIGRTLQRCKIAKSKLQQRNKYQFWEELFESIQLNASANDGTSESIKEDDSI